MQKMAFILGSLLVCLTILSAEGNCGSGHFVPNSQAFWDDSKNWTTNFGPAYRDTVEEPTNFLPCTGQFALCAESGPEPLPCTLDKSGRFARCKCTVQNASNFVQVGGILNEKAYQNTIAICGVDGANCFEQPDKAPVCAAIKTPGKFIPGAQIISDFSSDEQSNLVSNMNNAPDKPALTICPKGPYAGCMTSGCNIDKKTGDAECTCPVFWGIFQLVGSNQQCDLGNKLVWSASYTPALDVQP
jgi:hypothetical protein